MHKGTESQDNCWQLVAMRLPSDANMVTRCSKSSATVIATKFADAQTSVVALGYSQYRPR